MKANVANARKLNEILALYESQSGQMINKDKSAAMFSKGTKESAKQAVLGELGIPRESRNERYLGLPCHLGASKQKEFEYLKEKIWQRIQGWKERFLSKVGKEILIKAIAQAIPTYAMSCFDLTKALCDEISKMICRYWWNNQEDKNKCHWDSWEKMSRSKEEGGMGFRDLHVFNLAMLARQGWRLLQNPDSLCCTVLKALYFPDCSILEAVPKAGISYSWRSILRGAELLKDGVICRVGSGEEIDAFKDPWIPRGTTRRPCTPPPRDSSGEEIRLKVADLIDHDSTTWNADLIMEIFHPDDVRDILAIPLRPEMEDWIAWHFDSKGLFSVKSAYRLGISLKDERAGRITSTSASPSNTNPIWKKIWSLKLPGKVKVFTWRLCYNSLPTRMNIKRKCIELDTLCPMCNRADEDGGHLFLKCKQVKPVWRDLLVEDIRLSLLEAPDAMAVIEHILALKAVRRDLVLILLWDWWTTRNNKNAEEKTFSSAAVCHRIQRHMLDFTQQIHTDPLCISPLSGGMSTDASRWVKPPTDKVKINFDAAFFESTREGAWGFVARSDTGQFIAAAAGKLSNVRDAFAAEAEACVAAAEGASAIGLHRVIFESDCQTLVYALQSRSHDLAPIGVLLKEVRSICIGSFESYSFQFVPRTCNAVAHLLAQHGLRSDSTCVGWEDDAPSFIVDLVASECAVHPL